MRSLRLLAALAALVAAAFVTAEPASAEGPDPNIYTVCQLYCGGASLTCSYISPSEFCVGYFAGCMTGCGF